jgi:hypothetical protein
MCILGHHRYLGRAHPYRRNRVAFNGQLDRKPALERVSSLNFLKKTEECEEWVKTRIGPWNDKEDLVHTHGVK